MKESGRRLTNNIILFGAAAEQVRGQQLQFAESLFVTEEPIGYLFCEQMDCLLGSIKRESIQKEKKPIMHQFKKVKNINLMLHVALVWAA